MKIVICGGGTAGWLAALMIKKIQKHSHDITVIESSKIGIIGAGEGSTGYLTDIIQGNTWDYGCNEEDFFKETSATIKLGIEHRDWKTLKHSYYGPIDGSRTAGQLPDVSLCYALKNDIPVHLMSEDGFYIEHKKTNFWYDENGKFENTKSHAYHFDGHKVGQYFKKICMADSVNHKDSEIIEVLCDENGITGLRLSGDEIITADFYIDCTGFSRKLMNGLDVKWISYNKNLPVNTAMPFLLNYEKDETVYPVTTAWAQKYGWMWQIPIADRKGCGYVYDSNHISDEQAKNEIENVLGRTIDPIKIIKFDTGRLEKVWYKNCLSLGLSAAFAEPLEATSIHSTIIQLTTFIFDYLRDTKEETVNFGSQNIYNKKIGMMYDDFRDFLIIHYQTQRKDTEFWRYVSSKETRTDHVNNIIELCRTRIPKGCDFNNYYGSSGSCLWNWVLVGLGYINKQHGINELNFHNVSEEMIELTNKIYMNDMNERIKKMLESRHFLRG